VINNRRAADLIQVQRLLRAAIWAGAISTVWYLVLLWKTPIPNPTANRRLPRSRPLEEFVLIDDQ
jgi:hypothetical protein